MQRRTILQGLGGAGALTAVGTASAWHRSGSIPKLHKAPAGEWANWAGNQKAAPNRLSQPSSIVELQTLVRETKAGIRAVGAGHSFSGLVPTDDLIVNLDKISGVISADIDNNTAWVHAGSRLRDLSPALDAQGLAFKNLGDIDVQSVAGAIGTATHGTGKTLPCLSAEINAIKLMTGTGDIMTISRGQNEDILKAAQVSMGTLGIITEAEIALRPAFKLRRKTWVEPLSQTLDEAEARWDTYRNYEFLYFPHADQTLSISHEETDDEITNRLPSEDDEGTMQLKQARDFLIRAPKVRRSLLSSALADAPTENVVGISWKLLATERNVGFTEMEYHLPVDTAFGCLREVIKRIEAKGSDVFFPIEVRRTAGDSAWLSPFQHEDRISIAVHAFFKDNNDWMFSQIEPLFLKAGGRPHWGKLHTLTAPDLERLYPDFDRYRAVRAELDPTQKFLNSYMRTLLGVEPNG